MTREEILKIAKPILFNTDMVRAIMDGRKTVTRKVVKGFIPNDAVWGYTIFTPKGYISCRGTFADGYGEKFFKLQYNTADILYVRETWTEEYKFYYRADYDSDYLEPCETLSGGYPADCRNYPGCVGCTRGRQRIMWNPSIHMPKEAARLFLKVKDVRVERLQDITEEQAKAEGIREYSKDGKLWKYAVTDDWWIEYHNKYRKEFSGSWWQDMPRTAKEAFSYLWDSTIKKKDLDKYGWDANPWVWVIEFERVEV